MVSHLINRTLLGIHFLSLFTKHLEQEPATHKGPLNLVHKFTSQVGDFKCAVRGSGRPKSQHTAVTKGIHMHTKRNCLPEGTDIKGIKGISFNTDKN